MANPDMVADIAAFHEKFRLTYDGKPRFLPKDIQAFREMFIREEFNEYLGATASGGVSIDNMVIHKIPAPPTLVEDLENALDSLVDLVYVALGTSYLHGFNFAEAWRRVHERNMAKVRVDHPANSKRGSGYDVVKPPGWYPPSHTDLVQDHAHRTDK